MVSVHVERRGMQGVLTGRVGSLIALKQEFELFRERSGLALRVHRVGVALLGSQLSRLALLVGVVDRAGFALVNGDRDHVGSTGYSYGRRIRRNLYGKRTVEPNVRQPYKKGQAMLRELIEGLSQEQKRELAALGVPHPRLSEWKHGKGVPSRRAVAALAQVTGVDLMEIEREVMALEMKPEDRELFRGILKIPAGAMTALILILGIGFPAEKANADNGLAKPHDSAGIYIVASVCRAVRAAFRAMVWTANSRAAQA